MEAYAILSSSFQVHCKRLGFWSKLLSSWYMNLAYSKMPSVPPEIEIKEQNCLEYALLLKRTAYYHLLNGDIEKIILLLHKSQEIFKVLLFLFFFFQNK